MNKEIIFTVMAIILVGAFCFGIYGFILWFYYKIFSGAYHLLELLINKIQQIEIKRPKVHMILGDIAIREYLGQGKGVIGFKPENINPNSVDLTLNSEMSVYANRILDCRQKNEVEKIEMTSEGYVIIPNVIYLATTNETLDLNPMLFEKTICSTGLKFEAKKHICARVEGKSSLGRLGLFIHITAGWIDAGFKGSLVLELTVVQPLRIYPNMKICQISFMESTEVEKHYGEKEGSKYQNQIGAQESKMHENFKK